MSKAAIITLYILFVATLLEGTSRLALIIPVVARRLGVDEDYTHRRAWIERHREKNVDAFYTFDVYDSSTGWRTKPNVTNLKAFDNKQTLNTNANGLRGTKNFAYGKRQGTVRILILGDSFTFGDDVNDEDTYSSYLQRMLPGAEVINMGVHGYGHDQMLILLKEEGVKYEPDIIILGFLPLDMPRNLLNFSDFAKPRFVLKSGRLELTGSPVPPPEEILRGDWVRPRMVDIFSFIRFKIKRVLGIQRQQMQDITAGIITEMIDTAERVHAVPILAYLPRGKEISTTVAETPGETYMHSICRAKGTAKCISTRASFAAKIQQGQTFKTGGHYDAAGHRAVAEAIARYLVTEGYVAASPRL